MFISNLFKRVSADSRLQVEDLEFSLESDLVQTFLCEVEIRPNPIPKSSKVAMEFNYSGGRSDILFLTSDGEIISVEAKLRDWRYALHQAYRNTNFSDYSYVLLPEKVARIAAQYYIDFSRRSVGLLTISESGIESVLVPERSESLNLSLREKAATAIRDYVTFNESGWFIRRSGARSLRAKIPFLS